MLAAMVLMAKCDIEVVLLSKHMKVFATLTLSYIIVWSSRATTNGKIKNAKKQVNGNAADAGIIPRAVIDIFKRVEELRAQGVKAAVHASFLEVKLKRDVVAQPFFLFVLLHRLYKPARRL